MKIPKLPFTWAIVLSAIILAVGLSFVEIKQHQEQKNDQSQITTQNTITKTVVVNIVEKNRKMKGLKWISTNIGISLDTKLYLEVLNELEPWQQFYSKVFKGGIIMYPIVEQKETTFTNKTTHKNSGVTSTTNINKIENKLFNKIKKWFKKGE